MAASRSDRQNFFGPLGGMTRRRPDHSESLSHACRIRSIRASRDPFDYRTDASPTLKLASCMACRAFQHHVTSGNRTVSRSGSTCSLLLLPRKARLPHILCESSRRVHRMRARIEGSRTPRCSQSPLTGEQKAGHFAFEGIAHVFIFAAIKVRSAEYIKRGSWSLMQNCCRFARSIRKAAATQLVRKPFTTAPQYLAPDLRIMARPLPHQSCRRFKNICSQCVQH